ncbi:MAG: PAS domain S-box protein [Bacteroidota bacterium]
MEFEEALFRGNPNPMWIYDTQTLELLDVNTAALDFYGYSRSKMLDLTLKELRPPEEVPDLLEEIHKNVDQLNKAGIWIHQKKDGTKCYVDIISHPITYQKRAAKLVTGHDVTELVVARNQTLKQRLFNQTITDALPGIYYLVSQEGRYLDWNHQLEDVTGYTALELKKLTPLDPLVPEHHKRAQQFMQKVFEQKSAEMEATIFTKQGQRIPYLFAARYLEFQGEPCLAGMGIDISFKKELETKAEQQHKLFDSIINQTDAVVYIKGPDSQLRFVNDRYTEILGVPKSELLGLTDQELLPDHEAKQIAAHDQQVRTTGENLRIHESVTLKGETREYMTLKVPLTDVPGYEDCIAGISTDITEMRLAENQARMRARQQQLIAELGIYAMQELDLQSVLNRTTREVTQLLDVEYCKVLELQPDKDRLLLKAGVGWKKGYVGHAIVQAQERSQAGYTLRSAQPVIVENLDEEERFQGPQLLTEHNVVSGMSTIIHGYEGPYGILGAHCTQQRTFSDDDIHFLQSIANLIAATVERIKAHQKYETLNAELEQRVQHRTEQLEAANQELESFSYSVSHDLRAPLRAIHGYANLLMDDHKDSLPAEPREFLNIILDESERMGELIDDLLAFSRMNRSQKEIQLIDMHKVIDHALEEVGRTYDIESAHLSIQDLPSVQADFKLLKQVWINLLSNAFKYRKEQEPPNITISGTENEQNVVYQIQDQGVGFDPKYKEKLFGVFERLHSSTQFEGTGIGLALVQRVIHRHNGQIWADSEVGKGSTFTFSLPKH